MTFYHNLKSLQGSGPSHRQPRPFKVSTKVQVLKWPGSIKPSVLCHWFSIRRFSYSESSIVWRSFLIFQKESTSRIIKPGFNQPIRYQLAIECEFFKSLQVTKVGTSIRCRDGSIPPCKTVMIAVEQIRNEDGLFNRLFPL